MFISNQLGSRTISFAALTVLFSLNAYSNDNANKLIVKHAKGEQANVVKWRRHIHENPELGNREFKTAEYVANHLKLLDFDEVNTGVAHTGVVGILHGNHEGPVVALRADMDALPITEKTELSFASKVTSLYKNEPVGVMHACGHDAHTAMLMGTASVLSKMKDKLHGSVMFVFQPAEEGPPVGEEGGAKLMLDEGLFEKTKPEVIFGLHVIPFKDGALGYRKKGIMASSYGLKIDVQGKQTHGAMPWAGQDPITVGAQIITALQMIPSRQVDITKGPSLISIGRIDAGVRANVIPEKLSMEGIIRLINPDHTKIMHEKVINTAHHIAASAGLKADVEIKEYYPVTYNTPSLVDRMLPSLRKVGIASDVIEVPPMLGSEDFSFYQQEIPGLYLLLGAGELGAPNHSPYFDINEDVMEVGVKALSTLAIDYLAEHKDR